MLKNGDLIRFTPLNSSMHREGIILHSIQADNDTYFKIRVNRLYEWEKESDLIFYAAKSELIRR